jgi:hypothetical protein
MHRSKDKTQRKSRGPPTDKTLEKRRANNEAKKRRTSTASGNRIIDALGVVTAAPAAPRMSL